MRLTATRHEAILLFSFPDAIADAIHHALAPETEAQVPKTRAVVTRSGGDVRVHVHAEDLSALRAARSAASTHRA